MSEIVSSLGIHWQSLLAQFINFGILAFVLYRFAIKPALTSLDARVKSQEQMESNASNIEARLQEIEDSKAAVIAEARNEGKKIIAQTQQTAAELEAKLKAEAQSQAQKIVADAKKAIEADRSKFYEDLKSEVASLVTVALEKTVGKYIDSDAQHKLSKEAVEHITAGK